MAFRLMKIRGPVIWVLFFRSTPRTGQVYKLRSPSSRYLASLPTQDFSNPTKDWGFPQLPFGNQIQTLPACNGNCEAKLVKGVRVHKDLPSLLDQVGASENHEGSAYRGRAAERRALDGGFGVGPGQMRSTVRDNSGPSSPFSVEEAAGEALNISFRAGRYARRTLGSVGWKEGFSMP